MKTIRVVLADDHSPVREHLRRLLEKTNRITVVGEAGDGYQALELVKKLEPEVLVLDMEMPGMSGLTVARRLQRLNLPVRVLALSAYNDKQYIHGVLEAGATGYLIKGQASPDTIISAVQGVTRSEP